jgi:hypothetical protein
LVRLAHASTSTMRRQLMSIQKSPTESMDRGPGSRKTGGAEYRDESASS